MEKVEVLQFESRDYTKDGKARTFREALVRYEGKVFKFGVAEEVGVLKAGVFKVMEISLTTFKDNLEPRLRIVKAE